jgi:hypothetical protein
MIACAFQFCRMVKMDICTARILITNSKVLLNASPLIDARLWLENQR